MSKDNKKSSDSIGQVTRRYNTTIFIVLLAGTLVAAILSLVSVVATAYETVSPDDPSNQLNTSFDDTTLNQLERFKSSSNNTNQSLPSGRINPFSG